MVSHADKKRKFIPHFGYQFPTAIQKISLRIIVVTAALIVTAVAIATGTWIWTGVTNEQYSQLDRRLDSVSSLELVDRLLNPTGPSGPEISVPHGQVITIRTADRVESLPSGFDLPKLDPGYADIRVENNLYRVRSFTIPNGISVAVGEPILNTERLIASMHWRIFGLTAGFIAVAIVVGWVISLLMVNPFRVLAQQARLINAQFIPEEVNVRGVREAVEIAEAVEGMLARIAKEQERTKAALESARDFAAVASHELRTPLTAMRTNLEVLSTLDLKEYQRSEVIEDTIRTQSRIESTLWALERLAQGDLVMEDDHVHVDCGELLDRAAHDAVRSYPHLSVSLLPSQSVHILGLPAGLRLVVDNAIANAVKHGGATEVRLSAVSSVEGVEIAIDDNGSGVPADEREVVFERFVRGSTASRSGSGLGLALVKQQAYLHGGQVSLEVSPLGGTRLVLRLPSQIIQSEAQH